MKLQISKWGNSLAVRLPAAFIRNMGAKAGEEFDVGGATDEGHGDEVHLALEREFDVGVIFFRQRGDGQRGTGQVDALMFAEHPAI